jgi:hypothetical protein
LRGMALPRSLTRGRELEGFLSSKMAEFAVGTCLGVLTSRFDREVSVGCDSRRDFEDLRARVARALTGVTGSSLML